MVWSGLRRTCGSVCVYVCVCGGGNMSSLRCAWTHAHAPPTTPLQSKWHTTVLWKHTHIHIHMHTNTFKHTCTHTCTHMYTHAHTHTHTHTRTHTHTHTHTYLDEQDHSCDHYTDPSLHWGTHTTYQTAFRRATEVDHRAHSPSQAFGMETVAQVHHT